MRLLQAVDLYVAHKQSLGMRCQTTERILRAFCKAMGDINVTETMVPG
jgi:hypothetical protein